MFRARAEGYRRSELTSATARRSAPFVPSLSQRLLVKQASLSHRVQSTRLAIDSIKFGAKIWHSTAELPLSFVPEFSPSVKPLKHQILCCQLVASLLAKSIAVFYSCNFLRFFAVGLHQLLDILLSSCSFILSFISLIALSLLFKICMYCILFRDSFICSYSGHYHLWLQPGDLE